jgi:hypothetical protein
MNPRNTGIFVAPPVASGSNRTNTQGDLSATGSNRSSQTINTSLGAGQTVQFPVAGNSFYLRAATAPLQIRPSNAVFDTYTPGTGLRVDEGNQFSLVEVFNPSPNPVGFSLFLGYGGFIDNRLIIETGVIFPVINPNAPTGSFTSPLLVPDLSGQAFVDAAGKKWIALNRIALQVTNVSGSVLNIKDITNTNFLAAIPNGTAYCLQASGDFAIVEGSGTVNSTVIEIYNCLAATT